MSRLFVVPVLLLATILSAVTLTVIGPWAGPEMEKFMPVLREFEKQTGIKIEYKIYRAEDLRTFCRRSLQPRKLRETSYSCGRASLESTDRKVTFLH